MKVNDSTGDGESGRSKVRKVYFRGVNSTVNSVFTDSISAKYLDIWTSSEFCQNIKVIRNHYLKDFDQEFIILEIAHKK